MKMFSYGFRVGPTQALGVLMTVRSESRGTILHTSNKMSSPSYVFIMQSHKTTMKSITYSQFRGYTAHQMNMMEAASAAFTVFFTLESLLKIGACGWRVIPCLCSLLYTRCSDFQIQRKFNFVNILKGSVFLALTVMYIHCLFQGEKI